MAAGQTLRVSIPFDGRSAAGFHSLLTAEAPAKREFAPTRSQPSGMALAIAEDQKRESRKVVHQDV
jgi:hypothetical protein